MRGIYMIRNRLTGDCYVGRATDITARWNGHRALLKRGEHHSEQLQTAWMIDGEDAFEFLVLQEVAEGSLQNAESDAIARLAPRYNIAAVGHEQERSSAWVPLSERPAVTPGNVMTITYEMRCLCCGAPMQIEERRHLDAGFGIREWEGGHEVFRLPGQSTPHVFASDGVHTSWEIAEE